MCSWHPTRAPNGTLIPYPPYFPHGIKPVVDYVHSLGLRFGLYVRAASPEPKLEVDIELTADPLVTRYTSVGTQTCHHGWSPGSFGHYEQDAQLFASWGVDYVKVERAQPRRCPNERPLLLPLRHQSCPCAHLPEPPDTRGSRRFTQFCPPPHRWTGVAITRRRTATGTSPER